MNFDPVEFFHQIHEQIFDPARLPVAVISVLIVVFGGLVFGPLGGNANPFIWRVVDFLFGPLGGKLDKTERKSGDLATRGFIITITALIVGFLIGHAFQTLSTMYPNYKMVDVAALTLVLSAGAGWYALLRLYRAVEGKAGVKGAFYSIAATTRTNLTTSDEFTITRVGIGMGAKLLDKGIVAPVLWYLIAGLPAAYLYATLAALSWRFGKEGFSKGFGATANGLEKLLGMVPNLFSGLMIALAGLLTPKAGMTRSLLSLLPAKKGHSEYFQGGAPVTSMAYALNVSLGGATQDIDGSAIQRAWAGPEGATAKLEAKHLHRGLYITVMAHLLFITAVLVAIVAHGRGFFS